MFNEKIQKEYCNTTIENFLRENNLLENIKSARVQKYLESLNYSIEDLKANPYILTGIFDVEKIDKSFKHSAKNKNTRVKTLILYALNKKIIEEGHTFFIERDFVKEIAKKYALEELDISLAISDLANKKILVKKEKGITSNKYYYIESYIVKSLRENGSKQKGKIKSEKNLEGFLASEEQRIGFTFSDMQRKAIELANERFNVFSINGYAGAGKTTIAQSILNLYRTIYSQSDIICCALSGVAANRIKDVTGYESKTIHSLLGYNGDAFKFDADNKLPYKIIVLDEAGMVDTELFYKLLLAIDFTKTTLMITGDSAQLQSVQNGDIYNDILVKKLCKTITLDKVYRQSEEQVINQFAQNIRLAQIPQGYADESFEDFKFIGATSNNILDEVEQVAKRYSKELNILLLNDEIKEYISKFQVIVPIKRGDFGVYNINNLLQKIFNPTDDYEVSFYREKTITRIKAKDKVIHLRNTIMRTMSYRDFSQGKLQNVQEKKVFNGQIGVVLQSTQKGVFVYYPYENYVAIYTHNDIKKYGLLDLAYAITIHKSQGSQYANVVLPMSGVYKRMLNNQLLYTAITRAKDKLYLIGENEAFRYASSNNQTTIRNSCIKYCA